MWLWVGEFIASHITYPGTEMWLKNVVFSNKNRVPEKKTIKHTWHIHRWNLSHKTGFVTFLDVNASAKETCSVLA